MYTPREKVLFILDATGSLTEQEVHVVQQVCPELNFYPPYHDIWRRDAQLLALQEASSAISAGPAKNSGEADRERVLATLFERLDAAAELASYKPCGGDGYGDRYGMAPSPSMVDFLVSFIPKLYALARKKYRQEVLEEPRKRQESDRSPMNISQDEPIVVLMSGTSFIDAVYREFIHCVLLYEERWKPPRYSELLHGMQAGYGNVAHVMTRSSLSFDQIRAILLSFSRFASRQTANIAYVTSGRLQQLLSRLGELRQAEKCPLLRPRRG